jgi:hypothetical protein
VQLRQVEANLEHTALARLAFHLHLAAHQIGQHPGDGQAEAGAAGGAHVGGAATRERFEDAVEFIGRNAGAAVLDLELRHFALVFQAQHDAAAGGELDRVAEQVDQNLAQPARIGAHAGGKFAKLLVVEGDALVARLRFEHRNDFLDEAGEVERTCIQRQLAAFDAGDVQRALDQRQQMVAAAPDDADRLAAVVGNAGIGVENLGVAEDAVERRAQFVADRRDVAALGLVGLVGGFLGLLQQRVGMPVRFDFLHQQLGLPVGFLLRHLPALVGQHQPPGDDAGQQQQRGADLDEGGAHRGQARRIVGGQGQHFLVIEQADQQAEDRQDAGHQQQIMAQAGLQIGPRGAGQQTPQQRVPLRAEPRLGLAHIVAARIQRAAKRADAILIGRAMREVFAFVSVAADTTGVGDCSAGCNARLVIMGRAAPGNSGRR